MTQIILHVLVFITPLFSLIQQNGNLEFRYNNPVTFGLDTLDTLSQPPLIAFYPMQGNLRDSLHKNDDLAISHVEVRDSALWMDGREGYTDTTNQISTPILKALNLDDFHFTIDVWLDSITNPDASLNRNIIVGGSSFRWLLLSYNPVSKYFQMGYNNVKLSPNKFPFEYQKWYELGISYDRSKRELAFWIDGNKVDSQAVNLQHISDRNILLYCNCGPHPMRGFWRNLKVYSHEKNNDLPLSATCIFDQLPSTDLSKDGAFSIFIQGGDGPFDYQIIGPTDTLKARSHPPEINIEDFSTGVYDIVVYDWKDTVTCSVNMRAPQTDLPILSYYPINFDLRDTAKVHNSLSLSEVEFKFLEGLIIPGHHNQDSLFDQARTNLTELNFKDFYISLDIRIDSINGMTGRDDRSIFAGGLLWRWLTPIYRQSTKEIYLTYNNFNQVPGNFSFSYGQWYEIGIGYNALEKTGKFFINREEIGRDTFELITGDDNSFGLNCNCGPDPMKGRWKNLRIYSAPPDRTTTAIEKLTDTEDFQVFPNPFTDQVNLRFSEPLSQSRQLIYYNVLGRIIHKERLPKGILLHQLKLQQTPSGIYLLKIGSNIKWVMKK